MAETPRHPTLCLRWPDGKESISQHLTWRLVVQYLQLLARLGDDVQIVWLDERLDLYHAWRQAHG